MNIIELLKISLAHNASDLHLSVGLPPLLRINGDLHRLKATILESTTICKLLYSMMNDKHRQTFEHNLELDFSFEIDQLARFRINVFQQNQGLAAAIRIIPWTVKTLAELELPTIVKKLCQLSHGLVLVTGPTGSGKSTTLAAMLNHINEHQYLHVITLENPIEFIHLSKKALIQQREIERDTKNFATALRSALRADPDIILIGELRDQTTIRLALTAAETGHLVLGSLHTASAAESVNRIIDVFPGTEKNTARTLLAETLQAVLAQQLVKKINGGRTAALEIMLSTPAIRHLIRENKTAQLYSVMQTNRNLGMQTLTQHLTELVNNHIIGLEAAHTITINKHPFNQLE